MEDKIIKDLEEALNSLKKREEQIMKEIEKFKGKLEFDGKFALLEPKEVTVYKKDLEKVRAEIKEKSLEKRKHELLKVKEDLLKSKEELYNENSIKNLKNIYRNIGNVDNYVEKIIAKKSKEIDEKISKVENDIEMLDRPKVNSVDNKKTVKTDEKKTEKKQEKKVEKKVDEIPIEKEEEQIAPEPIKKKRKLTIKKREKKEPEKKKYTGRQKGAIKGSITREINIINAALKDYEDLKDKVNNLRDDNLKNKVEELQQNFGNMQASYKELLRRKQILETIRELTVKDFEQAEKEFMAYKKENDKNKEKMAAFKTSIKKMNTEYEKIKKEIEEIKEKEAEAKRRAEEEIKAKEAEAKKKLEEKQRAKIKELKEKLKKYSSEIVEADKKANSVVREYTTLYESLKSEKAEEWNIFFDELNNILKELDPLQDEIQERIKSVDNLITLSEIYFELVQKQYEKYSKDGKVTLYIELQEKLTKLFERAEIYRNRVTAISENFYAIVRENKEKFEQAKKEIDEIIEKNEQDNVLDIEEIQELLDRKKSIRTKISILIGNFDNARHDWFEKREKDNISAENMFTILEGILNAHKIQGERTNEGFYI